MMCGPKKGRLMLVQQVNTLRHVLHGYDGPTGYPLA